VGGGRKGGGLSRGRLGGGVLLAARIAWEVGLAGGEFACGGLAGRLTATSESG